MSRRSIREHTFRLLFRNEFYSPEEMEEQYGFYLEDKELEEDLSTELLNRVNMITEHIPEIDEKILGNLINWSIERIGKVELTLMRLAIFEILYDEDVPRNVAISEAVELSKKYGGENSGSFVNGVLSKI